MERAREAYLAAAGQSGQMVYFTGLALQKLGVGMAVPLPFELDIKRANQIDAYILLSLGRAGLRQPYAQELQALRALDPYNAKLSFFERLGLV